jgi:hypothetical protein
MLFCRCTAVNGDTVTFSNLTVLQLKLFGVVDQIAQADGYTP